MFRQSEQQRLAVYGKNPHHGCHLETARPEYRGVCRGGDSSSSDQSTCPFSLTRGHLTWRGGLNDYWAIIFQVDLEEGVGVLAREDAGAGEVALFDSKEEAEEWLMSSGEI